MGVRTLILVGAAWASWWTAARLSAAPLLTETFNYSDGPLVVVSTNLWVHHSGATTGEVAVTAGRVFLTQANTEDVSVLVPGQPYPTATNLNLYVGLRVHFTELPAGAGEYFAHFKNTGPSFRDRIFATTNGAAPGCFRVGVASAASAPSALVTSNLSLGTDHLLVTRLTLSNATCTLWVEPAAETDPGVTATDPASAIAVSGFALRQALSSGNGMGGLNIGALAIGTSFEDVLLGAVPRPLASFSVLLYNVNGNGKTNWSTNAPQVQAIGRQLVALQPDIIAFNEIPRTETWQMTNWVRAFLGGYYLATNSGTDGYIRNVVASRYPITRAQSWLDGASLTSFGFNGNVARDLFEAQIALPGFPQPLHVFVAHLKATISTPQEDADQRAAEAAAFSNFFANVFLPTNRLRPYLLAGDLNEDIFRPETNRYTSGQPVQRLTSPPTGLVLTTPVNPVTFEDYTESVQRALVVRFDYILPGGLLASNVLASQVFRTSVLTNPAPPAPALTNDDQTASDHLPVLLVFGNPYDKPFRLTGLTRRNDTTTLEWESVPGQPYRLEASADTVAWAVLASNLLATTNRLRFTTDSPEAARFFRVYRVP